ncbi:MAG: phosphate acyltransferase PlsX [Candidatus Latescibacteria bacterium]|nr:phosphate acyltransferase PlsX [Candidatus Latescibacterota bacterium]
MRIAVDAMGGDNVPDVLVEGSLDALRLYSDVEITLVGDEKRISNSLERFLQAGTVKKSNVKREQSVRNRVHITHADEVIEMCDAPAQAIRTKKGASIVVANKLCRANEVDAVISAGNTGAAMASSLLYMGRLAGVSRPAITALFPTKKNFVAILDVGANTDCKPEHLYQFAVMASIYTSHVLGYQQPRIGLLNIGEERTKGNELTDVAYGLLENSDLNFIGNVEGRDIFNGVADVVVCDGFVGNVLLKFGESIFSFVTHLLRKYLAKSIWRKMGAYLMKPAFRAIKTEMSPEDYGGAPLLGVDGISIICHGNSTPYAIRNAIRVARKLVLEEVNEQIKLELAKKNLK